uniref:Uncharacterized protein n=1 Tax=Magnetococcus massalia (strain MO-1) TaxID=451514 RepID=A0A1S7LL47_MAGMO|nr:protein of unknown function [Candidatus Magnetococcus massalia]
MEKRPTRRRGDYEKTLPRPAGKGMIPFPDPSAYVQPPGPTPSAAMSEYITFRSYG